ncbi:MAG: hypothetical protein IKZ47_01810 [Clostridia bacterium]|nr:hypothetical protein [Clostridia bacterium]
MIRILLKKQLTEIFRKFFVDTKKNKARSRLSTILWFLIFAALMIVFMGGTFGIYSYGLYPIAQVGFGWLYYAIFALLSVLLGIFGSVFSTYSGLYLAKDNDILLSMPVPVSSILTSRLLGVYFIGFIFSSVPMIPAFVIKFIFVGYSAWEICAAVLFLFLLSLIVLVLSCVFGYIVARISVKLKNKSYIVVAIAIAFIALYYYLCYNAGAFFSDLIENVIFYSEKVKGSAYPVYYIGSAADGGVLPLAVCFAVVIAALFITVYIISRSFIKIATSANVTARVKYKQKEQKVHSVAGAILLKEAKRFTSSPNYMLNCGMGVLFMIAAAVLMLIKAGDLSGLSDMRLGDLAVKDYIAVIAVAAMFLMISTNDIAAPSVSLEGKALWQVRSLPVDTKIVLRAKYLLQIYINAIPALFCAGCVIAVIRPDVLTGLLIALLTAAYVVLHALFCLFCGLIKVNLEWTNEIVPIKQSMSVFLALFGGWGYAVAVGGLYFLFDMYLSEYLGGVGVWVYLALILALTVLFAALFYKWINKKGVKIFESL